jgi:protein involved in polysaccharide export with SLBB domain
VDALNLAGGMTRNELVTIVVATRPRGDAAKKDQRKTNVNKALNNLVQRGTVIESGTGMISLPEKKAVK